jgi:hypothetical protein
MLDDLRNSASQSFIDEIGKHGRKKNEDGRILGMTAPQRFLVSILLLVMTCAMGTLLLIAFGKVSF